MKKVILLLLLPISVFAQNNSQETSDDSVKAAYESLPKVGSRYEFSEIISFDTSFNKDVLYHNARLFIARFSKATVQYDDPVEGRMIARISFHLEDDQNVFLSKHTEERDVSYTLEISCMDGKYKYSVYDVSSDYDIEQVDGNSQHPVSHGTLSLDDAYGRTTKGNTKKIDKRLFMASLSQIKSTITALKQSMGVLNSKDGF